MMCPFFWGGCMCAARQTGLYVPPSEVEFHFCRAKQYFECVDYRRVVDNGNHGGNRGLKKDESKEKPEI